MLVSFREVSEITDTRLQNLRTLLKETTLVPSTPHPPGQRQDRVVPQNLFYPSPQGGQYPSGRVLSPPASQAALPLIGVGTRRLVTPGTWPPPGPGAGGDGEHLRLARSCLAAPSRPRPRSRHHCGHGVWARGRLSGPWAVSPPAASREQMQDLCLADVSAGTPSRRVSARPGRESSPPGHRRSC